MRISATRWHYGDPVIANVSGNVTSTFLSIQQPLYHMYIYNIREEVYYAI